MNYTHLALIGFGIAGILLHNLVEINKINKDPNKGNFNLLSYLRTEWAAIMISFIVVFLAGFLKKEIATVEVIQGYIGFAYVAVGYLAQSLLIALMGKAENTVNNITK